MRRADPIPALFAVLTLAPAAFAGDYALAAASVGSSGPGSASADYALRPAVFGGVSAPASSGDYTLAGGFAAQTGFPEVFLVTATGSPALTLPALAAGTPSAVTPLLLRIYGAQSELTLTAPEPYQLSRRHDDAFASSLVLSPAELIPPGLTIYLRLAPGTPVGVVHGRISVAGAPSPAPSFHLSSLVTGPVATTDHVIKPTLGAQLKITVSTLLANDYRITSTGATAATGLTLTAVTAGPGNSVSLAAGRVFFTGNPSASSESFNYTVSDGVSTATGLVTVTLAAPAPFTLQLTAVGTAAFDGTNTSATYGFIGVPNQIYTLQYTSNLAGEWTTLPALSTGSTGSFAVTLNAPGNHAAVWNSRIFFRAVLSP